ncbi:P-loop containing nucleoside triphosphate hydrolase protein, partial [Melanomma pulvis-pyrius CBS 109.77]
SLSAGQQQLFSLGRALLRRRANGGSGGRGGGILLLDEMSSAVDHETEALMQDIVDREFAGYTVVSVAHRLEMAVRFADTVVVMDGGAVVEMGTPRDLVLRDGGWFRRLYRAGL